MVFSHYVHPLEKLLCIHRNVGPWQSLLLSLGFVVLMKLAGEIWIYAKSPFLVSPLLRSTPQVSLGRLAPAGSFRPPPPLLRTCSASGLLSVGTVVSSVY